MTSHSRATHHGAFSQFGCGFLYTDTSAGLDRIHICSIPGLRGKVPDQLEGRTYALDEHCDGVVVPIVYSRSLVCRPAAPEAWAAPFCFSLSGYIFMVPYDPDGVERIKKLFGDRYTFRANVLIRPESGPVEIIEPSPQAVSLHALKTLVQHMLTEEEIKADYREQLRALSMEDSPQAQLLESLDRKLSGSRSLLGELVPKLPDNVTPEMLFLKEESSS